MSRLSLKALQAAAGAAAGGATYVEDVFSTYLYEGNGSTQTITNGIDLDGEGGMIWTKERSPNARNHFLGDSERNNFRNYLYPNLTNAESGLSGAGFDISSVSSTGYSLGTDNYTFNNESGSEQVSWTFRKQEGFFDVVTYTGTGGSAQNISHNLGTVPGAIFIKRTDVNNSWAGYHRSAGTNQTYSSEYYNLSLNSTLAASLSAYWNYTAPTSTEFTVGANHTDVNASGGSYVAYLFAHNDGDGEFGEDGDQDIIKCGSYTEPSSGTWLDVNLGFEAQWVMVKSATSASQWTMFDVMRDATGQYVLQASSSNVEQNFGSSFLTPTATGFQTKGGLLGSGQTIIYIAIRRPHKPAKEFAATELFTPATGTTDYSGPQYDAGFPVVDLIFEFLTITGAVSTVDRVRGDQKRLFTYNTNAETTSSIPLDMMYGAGDGGSSYAQSWMFRRAPGFFDVVAYKGTGGVGTVSHYLGVTPELIVVKNRDSSFSWPVYCQAGGINEYLYLNQTATSGTYAYSWGYQAPSETQFYVNVDIGANTSNNNHIAYLFATVPGISKVGSYTGTGANLDVNCGFTSGARFVLVKRTDSTGDWYVWDSARGIVAGNDPYVLLNSNAAQVTSTDYIDPLSSGFTITSSAPAALNASGGNYIFLAIA